MQNAIGLKLGEYLHAPTHSIAQRIGRVDVLDGKTISILWMEGDSNLEQYSQACPQTLVCQTFKLSTYCNVCRCPTIDTRLRNNLTTFLISLHQFSIEMATGSNSALAKFALHPISVGKFLSNGVAHQGI